MNSPSSNFSWPKVFKSAADDWMEDKALRLSAALAYYAVFSIAPLLVICIGMAGLVFGDEAVAGKLHGQMQSYVGSQAAEALQSMVESASKRSDGFMATVTGLAVLMLGASGVFAALKDALNTVWEVKPAEGTGIFAFAREKFLNFGMVLVIGFLLLVSLVLSTLIAGLHEELEPVLALPALVWTSLTFVVSLGLEATLFAWIFKVLPDVHTKWRDVWVGAILTALLFEVGKTGLGWYLGRESTANAYGAAGSVVLLLLWVYYASCILLFGAEFTRSHARLRGRLLAPASGSQWATTADRQQEGLDHQAPPMPKTRPSFGNGNSETSRPSTASSLLTWGLKYVEARGVLLTVEAKEAFRQVLAFLAILVALSVAAFVGWLMLAGALVELAVDATGWSRLSATLAVGGAHFAAAVLAGVLLWRKVITAQWFPDTLNEFKKDRQWLRKH